MAVNNSPAFGGVSARAAAGIRAGGIRGDWLGHHSLPVNKATAKRDEEYDKQVCKPAYARINIHASILDSNIAFCIFFYLLSEKVYHCYHRLTSKVGNR